MSSVGYHSELTLPDWSSFEQMLVNVGSEKSWTPFLVSTAPTVWNFAELSVARHDLIIDDCNKSGAYHIWRAPMLIGSCRRFIRLLKMLMLELNEAPGYIPEPNN